VSDKLSAGTKAGLALKVLQNWPQSLDCLCHSCDFDAEVETLFVTSGKEFFFDVKDATKEKLLILH